MRFIRNVLTISCILLAGCSSHYAPLPTVNKVDLNQYTGTWYEIESLPNRFQRGCQCTTATYDKIPGRDDVITVHNQCYRNGQWTEAKGKAFKNGDTGAKLKVQFFWPFRGDYWILDLGPEKDGKYSYVMVGNPSRKYLWFLARDKSLPESTLKKLTDKAKQLGFSTEQLNKTSQNCSR